MTEGDRYKIVLLACGMFVVNSLLPIYLEIDVVFWKRLIWDLSHWLAIGLFLWAINYPLVQGKANIAVAKLRDKIRQEVYELERAKIQQLAAYPLRRDEWAVNFIGRPFPTELYIAGRR